MHSIEVVYCVCCRKTSELQCLPLEHIFVTFVEDNATMTSIPYFENHVLYQRILCKTKGSRPN